VTYLQTHIDHPVALIVALILSAPFVWFLGRLFFRGIAGDMEDAGSFYVTDIFGGPSFLALPIARLALFLFFSAAVIVLFYQICAWFLF
jgi:hypothetical protein